MKEAFRNIIIVTIPFTTHALDKIMPFQREHYQFVNGFLMH
jgi:hypothetical protein